MKVVDERVTLISDPMRPRAARRSRSTATAYPLGRRVWIENGVLKNSLIRSLLGAEEGRAAERRRWRRTSVAAAVAAAAAAAQDARRQPTLEELIASTQRGILVTHFCYIRGLDQRTVLFTGLTRDGTFLIENGKITRPVKNLPLERVAGLRAQQSRDAGPSGAGDLERGRFGAGGDVDASAQGARFQLYERVGRGVGSPEQNNFTAETQRTRRSAEKNFCFSLRFSATPRLRGKVF